MVGPRNARLFRVNQDEIVVGEVVVQVMGNLRHPPLPGRIILPAHHKQEVIVLPDLPAQDQEIIPIGKRPESGIHRMIFVDFP